MIKRVTKSLDFRQVKASLTANRLLRLSICSLTSERQLISGFGPELTATTDSNGQTLRVFSAIQPTGALHLGNYLGAVRQWIQFTTDPRVQRTIYSVVDLHSLTTIKDKEQTAKNIKLMTASLLGCGLDPNRTILFRQSDIPFHGQLSWILSTLCSMSQLSRFPQFKAI